MGILARRFMKRFAIQTVNGKIKHDFCFQLDEAIQYCNWYNDEDLYESIYVNNLEQAPKGSIPVGSLEFVFQYVKKYYGIQKEQIHPINIPPELRIPEFLGRKVYISQKQDIVLPSEMWVKSNEQYKTFANIVNDVNQIPEGEYLVSEIIDIESEWRAFVFRGMLLGIKHYSGSFRKFPDIEAVEKMINVYKDAPMAYTLDVALTSEGCFVIEIHPFVSCGTYGFQDCLLPAMFIQGFNALIQKARN